MFVDRIGYTKFDALNDIALMESAIREDLNRRSTRVSAVIHPVKLVITNYPEGKTEEYETINNPEDPQSDSHKITFSRELWIEREDFMENAPAKYFRLSPGREVRLRSSYIVRCTGCKKSADGNIEEVYCEYIPNTRTGESDSNRKVKGTIHWVSTAHAIKAEVRLYDCLWKVENPRDELARLQKEGMETIDALKIMKNPKSLEIIDECYVETFLANTKPMDYFQFLRIGYFCTDKDSTPEHLIFNRTVSLKDTWKKVKHKA
jgi:glutaminyl-tRNA synthetase